jgi:stage IV sporulation protein A
MEDYGIYNDITQRTDGSIYIGVVGPVRTGKSTFVKRFMETLVLPHIENEYAQERARDELPQSAAGRTIMTTEPKFIPNEAVEISLDKKANFKVRMIDCVGYVVDTSLGYIEDNMPRMVSTPWFDEPIPFNKAAEIGTKKVISEHSTIGLVITTDGTICDIERNNYIAAEERVISELREINKPFIILLNSRTPSSIETQHLKEEMEEKYGVPVMAINCLELTESDIKNIIENVLFEFPIKEISINMPGWVNALDGEHWLKSTLYSNICQCSQNICKIREINSLLDQLNEQENIVDTVVNNINLGAGTISIKIDLQQALYYKIISEAVETEIKDDQHLLITMKEMAKVKKEYDKIAMALEGVKTTGYGIVTPTMDELSLEEPQIVKHGGRFGVRLRASAPSIHMIRANIETEVSPIVGSEKQSEELISYLMKDFEVDPKKIWESNFFGKSLHELVNEGLNNKLYRMPEDARFKLQETLQKIINEGSGGLICIIL